MSKIPICTSSKGNKLVLRNDDKKNITRTIGNGLNDAEKKALLTNHTKPLLTPVRTTVEAPHLKKSSPGSLLTNHTEPHVTTVPSTVEAPHLKISPPGPLTNHSQPLLTTAPLTVRAPHLKISSPVPSTCTVPNKVAKAEKKLAVAPKIPPYDYKARFKVLLEKHKTIKRELNNLKEKHLEVSDKNEKMLETIEESIGEIHILKKKLLNTSKDLSKKSNEYETFQLDYEILRQENEELASKTRLLEELTTSLKLKTMTNHLLTIEIKDMTRRYETLSEENETLKVSADHLKKKSVELDKLRLDHKDVLLANTKIENESEALQNILANMYRDQRILRNTVLHLKGNIQVYCRVRPPLESEVTKQYKLSVVHACTIEVEKIELLNSARKGKPQHSFTFNGIFKPHSSQEDVFANVSPMVQSAIDGYNVCIFAYGQTGSGKTYTMEGGCGTEKYGIIPRALNMIFTCVDNLKGMGWILTVKASFLEIYHEIIYDLLNTSKAQENRVIKLVNSTGTDLNVLNLKEEEVRSSHDFNRLLIFARHNRHTSSRSHFVSQIKISVINEKLKEKFTSNLNLVDLAGLESGKTTESTDETKYINRSLSELSEVILSLQTNQSHIPYRNSKLTHLLMPSLGGNSKTLLLVHFNQFAECLDETFNFLRFTT